MKKGFNEIFKEYIMTTGVEPESRYEKTHYCDYVTEFYPMKKSDVVNFVNQFEEEFDVHALDKLPPTFLLYVKIEDDTMFEKFYFEALFDDDDRKGLRV